MLQITMLPLYNNEPRVFAQLAAWRIEHGCLIIAQDARETWVPIGTLAYFEVN